MDLSIAKKPTQTDGSMPPNADADPVERAFGQITGGKGATDMTKKEAANLLEQFQCDYNRELEETFSQTFSENDRVRLFFINENEAFTDGKNIVVDPAVDGLFADPKALLATEAYLHWPASVSRDPWYALRMITRAQTIHECLHILYTDFPCPCAADPRCDTKNKKTVMALISNIIEDAYIEAAGCSVYDNLELFLKFGRISRLFVSAPSEGTAVRVLSGISEEDADKRSSLCAYLNYMIDFLLYPMLRQDAPKKTLRPYVEQTKQLFLDGSTAESPALRYGFAQRIFDVIAPLIPDDETVLETDPVHRKLGGIKTHCADAGTPAAGSRKGKTQAVTVRLFTNLNGEEHGNAADLVRLHAILSDYEEEKQTALRIVTYTGFQTVYSGQDYDCSALHRKIKINENHPRINLNLRKAYQNIYDRYRINIDSYNSRFLNLLKARVPIRDEKYRFGSGITSTRLGDPKRRYWHRYIPGVDIPDMAVLLLIDGSGSMYGSRRDSAVRSSVILHEVLKKQGIAHAIVEHRAGGDRPEIDCNILVGFNAGEEEKYNLMRIDAHNDNRDGLALYWAERYINLNTNTENKLIVALSDGLPAHGADDYYPPVSTQDTANAVKKIMRRGTDIIAVALDDSDSFACYDMLKQIYPHIVACNDLKRLTGQLLTLISKQLNG